MVVNIEKRNPTYFMVFILRLMSCIILKRAHKKSRQLCTLVQTLRYVSFQEMFT